MVAFDVLEPALRSRGAPQALARDLYAGEGFRMEMRKLFEGEPDGRLINLTLEDALERISELEERVSTLEQRLQDQAADP
jgi:hypothetical protein